MSSSWQKKIAFEIRLDAVVSRIDALEKNVEFLKYISDAEQRHLFVSLDTLRHRPENFIIGKGLVIGGGENITVGEYFHAGNNFRLEAINQYFDQKFTPKLIIGRNVSFEDFCHVGCIEDIEIGDNTMIASKVYISDHSHGDVGTGDLTIPVSKRPLVSKPVKIGKNVWIGEGVCILPGVTLGDNVIVGANSVVTKSFEANNVIAGVPARIIRQL